MGRRIAAGALCIFLSGCFQTHYSYNGPKRLTTASKLEVETKKIGNFEAHDRGFYLFYGLIPIGNRVNGAELAAESVGEHDGAVNLRFSDGQDFVDMLISNVPCLFSLLCGSWSVWARGDVVDIVEESE